MYLLFQRSPDPVPYRGAYFRISPEGGDPARGSIGLPPETPTESGEKELALLLGLVLALGDAPAGGAPIRQFWLNEELGFEGKMGSNLAPHHAREAHRLAERIRAEWPRFLGSAIARLRGESRGDSHFRYPDGAWDRDHPAVLVTAWPPLPGEPLPPLE
jgi:hypothetical protein